MARIENKDTNPDLQRERQKASFNPEEITNFLDEGKDITTRRREVENMALKETVFTKGPSYYFLSRSEKYERSVEKARHSIKKIRELELNQQEGSWLHAIAFPVEPSPLNLHHGMFIPALQGQASEEQKQKWLSAAKAYEILGTYAQTEMGHGTHLRGVETTATYDSETEEFVLNSPTTTATKWWPGALGKTSNFVVLMARLIISGKDYGMQAFILQIRNLETHEPLPGITVGDIGPKLGYETVDNGFLRLDHVRIPRENMLMKNAQVLPNGQFVKSKNEKLVYGVMIYIRTMLVSGSGDWLSAAATIAVRYSCVRRQSELEPGKAEPQILDYQTQQYKLFPHLASAYAFKFAGKKMWKIYNGIFEEIQKGNMELLPELHAVSAGLKAFCTSAAMFGVEQCRLACGGHGYSQASGIAKIYADATPGSTYEGENTVMFLQTARYLMKAYRSARGGHRLSGSVAYLSKSSPTKSKLSSTAELNDLLEAYEHRAKRLVSEVGQKMMDALARGVKEWQARNTLAVELMKAAQAHCHFWIVNNFVELVCNCGLSCPSTKDGLSAPSVAVLKLLCKFYAAHGMVENSGDFLEDGYVSSAQMEQVRSAVLQMLDAIRPEAVALVDAFDFSDHELCSVLGRYDGNVYENLYNWAQQAPLNKTQVHESFHKYLKPLREEMKAKL